MNNNIDDLEKESLDNQESPEVDCDTENEVSESVDPLEKANEQIAELKDKYLRTVAEFDNYKKRTLKEKSDLILNGGVNIISGILPVVDDFERAIENNEKTDDVEALKEGFEIIYKSFTKVLKGLGVEKIKAVGKDFDVDYHEAVAMVPGVEYDKKGKVIDCIQNGYTLNDKVIRHAKVAVGQ